MIITNECVCSRFIVNPHIILLIHNTITVIFLGKGTGFIGEAWSGTMKQELLLSGVRIIGTAYGLLPKNAAQNNIDPAWMKNQLQVQLTWHSDVAVMVHTLAASWHRTCCE